MKEKEIFKRSGGITLIALVITIIVLLILAGVTIATLTGDNGLLSKSSGAKSTSTDAEIEEEIRLAWNKVYMDSYLDSTTDKANALKTELEKNGHTVEDVSGNGDIITITNYRGKNKVLNASTGTVEDKKPGIGDLVTKDNYGDYIDLGQSVEEVGTSSSADDWRILYNDKAGHVYAILADYLPINNAVIDSAGFSRSMEISATYNVRGGNRESLLAKLTHETAWNSLVPNALVDKGANVVGATTGDIIIASYNEKYNVSPAKNYTSTPWLYIDNDSAKGIDKLYILGSSKQCFGYWLASSYADNNSDLYTGDYRGPIYHDTYNSSSNGIRPVVSLPSNLQVTNNNGVWSLVNN